MILRISCVAWSLGTALALACGTAAGASMWTWQAVGAEAPQEERFEVRAGSVRWLDAQGRTQWHHARATGVLTQIDHEAGQYRRLDAEGLQALAAELGAAMSAQRRHIDALPPAEREAASRALAALMNPSRPWAHVEASDVRVTLQQSDLVAGTACRRIGLQAAGRPVGETCIADARALPGGDAVLQMLTALQRVADVLRSALPSAPAAAWPLHPLVVAARGGGLPLSVVEAVAGERRRELRLRAVQPLSAPGDEAPAVPPDYRPARAGG